MRSFIMILIVLFSIMLRLNLPSKVDASYMKKDKEGFLNEFKDKIIYSDAVADWTYKDFIFVKFACSERMKIELIAIPFKKWEIFDKNVSLCTGVP